MALIFIAIDITKNVNIKNKTKDTLNPLLIEIKEPIIKHISTKTMSIDNPK